MKRVFMRIFAVFLSVFLAASAFVIPSYAVAEWVLLGIEKVFEGFAIGWLASGSAELILGSDDFSDFISRQISTSVMSDNYVRCYYDEKYDRFQFSPSPNLTGEDELECAQFICDYMNDRMTMNSASFYFDFTGDAFTTGSSFVMMILLP